MRPQLGGPVGGVPLMIPVVGWMRGVLRVDAGQREVGKVVGRHAVYGVVLGAFVDAGLPV